MVSRNCGDPVPVKFLKDTLMAVGGVVFTKYALLPIMESTEFKML